TLEVNVGQSLFTSSSGSGREIEKIDRPFAADLYGGAKLNWYFKDEKMLQASLQVGTIGPAAKGKEAQELLHHIVGFYEIHGWEYQIKNEFSLNSTVSYTALLDRSVSGKTDWSINGFANIGNTFSGAGTSLLFRTGKINPLHESVSTGSRISNTAGAPIPNREIFFFARPSLYFTAYDATIQGG